MKNKSKLILGIGINDADYKISTSIRVGGRLKQIWICPVYRAWTSMLRRCYSKLEISRYPTYEGCSVDKSWHSFSSFKEWIVNQPTKVDWILDKDILVIGNKIYGPDTCSLISSNLNGFVLDSGKSRGKWPIGVCVHRKSGKFSAQCSNPFSGKRGHIGLFSCPDSAHKAWRRKKHEFSLMYADIQEDPRVASALRVRYLDDVQDDSL